MCLCACLYVQCNELCIVCVSQILHRCSYICVRMFFVWDMCTFPFHVPLSHTAHELHTCLSTNINQYQPISTNIKHYQRISTNINKYTVYVTNINIYAVYVTSCTQVCCPLGFTAQRGWDPVVGLGSPNFRRLKAALLEM